MIIDHPWYVVLLCLTAGAAYAAALYAFGRRPFARWLAWLLSALRFTAVSAIAFLLLAPVSRQTVHERQKPHVVVAVDRSLSVTGGADSTVSLAALCADLQANCQLTIDTFGNSSYTDIGEAMVRHRYDDVAAMVLATDGISNRGSNPASVAEGLPFPVYTVALGDTTRHRDAALTELRCNRIAMLGSDFPIEATMTAAGLKGKTTRLNVTDGDGRTLTGKDVTYDDNTYTATIAATLHASKPGLQRFTATLGAVDGEHTAANNAVTFYVDVIDTRRRVAIYANAPHPDIAALKRSIEGNPNYEATVIYANDAKKPDTSFSLAVLHNLPSATHTDIGFATGLPQIYVIGMQTDLARFNALHSGLEINARVKRANEVSALHQPAFSLFSLDEGTVGAIEAMPPLDAPFGESRTSEGLQMLLSARLGTIDTRQPLVAAYATGGQRRAFVWGEGLWRWRLADWQANKTHEHFDQLVAQLVSFTAMQHRGNRLQVEAARSYAEGETPVVRAQLYNENYELTTTPEVSLHLTGDSLEADYTFARDGQSYRLALPDLKGGLYRYRATADGLTAEGAFAVEALNLEQRSLVADHTLLRTVSATTGAEMYSPDRLAALSERLSALKPTIYTHTRYAELLRLPWVLALIILLLGAEWVLRKYHGEL